MELLDVKTKKDAARSKLARLSITASANSDLWVDSARKWVMVDSADLVEIDDNIAQRIKGGDKEAMYELLSEDPEVPCRYLANSEKLHGNTGRTIVGCASRRFMELPSGTDPLEWVATHRNSSTLT